MDDNEVRGRPVRALSDMEFDQQGTRRTSRATGLSAGRAEQFVHHSTRMPKLEPLSPEAYTAYTSAIQAFGVPYRPRRRPLESTDSGD